MNDFGPNSVLYGQQYRTQRADKALEDFERLFEVWYEKDGRAHDFHMP